MEASYDGAEGCRIGVCEITNVIPFNALRLFESVLKTRVQNMPILAGLRALRQHPLLTSPFQGEGPCFTNIP